MGKQLDGIGWNLINGLVYEGMERWILVGKDCSEWNPIGQDRFC